METRGQTIPYPTGGHRVEAQLILFLSRLLRLPRLQRVELSAQNIFVTRVVEDDEAVLPYGLSQIIEAVEPLDVEFLLQRIPLKGCSVQAPGNPLVGLNAAINDVEEQSLIACAILAPEGDYFDAYFGLPENTNMERFLGLKVARDKHVEAGKLIILGSPFGMLVETTLGIVLDTGVIV